MGQEKEQPNCLDAKSGCQGVIVSSDSFARDYIGPEMKNTAEAESKGEFGRLRALRLHHRLRLDEQHPHEAHDQHEFNNNGRPGVQRQRQRTVQAESGR
jgi:hypothetical protein